MKNRIMIYQYNSTVSWYVLICTKFSFLAFHCFTFQVLMSTTANFKPLDVKLSKYLSYQKKSKKNIVIYGYTGIMLHPYFCQRQDNKSLVLPGLWNLSAAPIISIKLLTSPSSPITIQTFYIYQAMCVCLLH